MKEERERVQLVQLVQLVFISLLIHTPLLINYSCERQTSLLPWNLLKMSSAVVLCM